MAKARLRDDEAEDSRRAAAWTATVALDVLLRLLHPFMPFVTEECAQRLPQAAATLQHRDWPKPPAWWAAVQDGTVSGTDRLLDLVQALRAARQDAGVAPSSRDRHPVVLRDSGSGLGVADVRRLVEALVPVDVVDTVPAGEGVGVVVGPFEASLHLGGGAGDRERLLRQRADVERQLARLGDQLARRGFVERAPEQVVEDVRRRLAEAEGELETLDRRLGGGGDGDGDGGSVTP